MGWGIQGARKLKFDEIVVFAETEQFLDTPVKRHSSGMYVRLAFAVAAHLEPEILLVEGVLAVGDAQFQNKCIGKMGEVTRKGRTVIFVSHNMIAIRNFCARSIWLQDGRVFQFNDTNTVTETYLQQSLRTETLTDVPMLIKSLPPNPTIKLESIEIRQDGQLCNRVVNGQPVEIEIQYNVLKRTTGLRVYFDLLDEMGNIIVHTFHDDDSEAIPTSNIGEYISTATIPANLLAPRIYELRVRATISNVRSCTGEGVGRAL